MNNPEVIMINKKKRQRTHTHLGATLTPPPPPPLHTHTLGHGDMQNTENARMDGELELWAF